MGDESISSQKILSRISFFKGIYFLFEISIFLEVRLFIFLRGKTSKFSIRSSYLFESHSVATFNTNLG